MCLHQQDWGDPSWALAPKAMWSLLTCSRPPLAASVVPTWMSSSGHSPGDKTSFGSLFAMLMCELLASSKPSVSARQAGTWGLLSPQERASDTYHPPLLEASKGWGSSGSATPSKGRELISPTSSQGISPSMYLMKHRCNRGLVMLPAVTNLQPLSSWKFPPLTLKAYLYFSLLPFNMELRFLALQGLWKNLSILPNVYSLLTIQQLFPLAPHCSLSRAPSFGHHQAAIAVAPLPRQPLSLPQPPQFTRFTPREMHPSCWILSCSPVVQNWFNSRKQRSNSSSKLLLWLTGEKFYEDICLNELEILMFFKLIQLLLKKDYSLNCWLVFLVEFSFLLLQLHSSVFKAKGKELPLELHLFLQMSFLRQSNVNFPIFSEDRYFSLFSSHFLLPLKCLSFDCNTFGNKC